MRKVPRTRYEIMRKCCSCVNTDFRFRNMFKNQQQKIRVLYCFLGPAFCRVHMHISHSISVSKENVKLSLCKLSPNSAHKAPNQFMFFLLDCTYVNPTYLILFHPQLTSGHDSKQHRVPHGQMAVAICLLPLDHLDGLHPQLKISLDIEQLCVHNGHLVVSSLGLSQ